MKMLKKIENCKKNIKKKIYKKKKIKKRKNPNNNFFTKQK